MKTNSASETRHPKEVQIPKSERNGAAWLLAEISIFEFRVSIGLRISNFEFFP
jgi:hypothetical protein